MQSGVLVQSLSHEAAATPRDFPGSEHIVGLAEGDLSQPVTVTSEPENPSRSVQSQPDLDDEDSSVVDSFVEGVSEVKRPDAQHVSLTSQVEDLGLQNTGPATDRRTPTELEFTSSSGQSSMDSTEKHDKVSQLTSEGRRNRPGVILLGRGNSFSLGRSEVILLHSSKHRKDGRTQRSAPVLPQAHLHNGEWTQEGHAEPSSSPPPLSNGDTDIPPLRDTRTEEELEALWCRAESVMAAKQGAVQRVLEDFGIGEAGGEDGSSQEEEIWQVVQEHANLTFRSDGASQLR